MTTFAVDTTGLDRQHDAVVRADVPVSQLRAAFERAFAPVAQAVQTHAGVTSGRE